MTTSKADTIIGGMSLDLAIKFCDALKVRNPRKLLDSDSDSSAD